MLLRCVRFELRRAMHEKSFMLSILIGGVVVMMDLYVFFMQYKNSDSTLLIQAWIGTDFQFAYNALFYVLLPVVACLPYGGSYYGDISAGYDKNIMLKTTRGCYMFSKGVAVYISAFSAVVIPLLVNLFLAAGFYKNDLPQRLTFSAAGIIDCNRFPELFSEKPALYCLVFILIDGLFAGLLGLMSLAVTRWCRSTFSATVLPFVFYITTGAIMVKQDGTSFAMMEMLNPMQIYISTYEEMAITYIIFMCACISVLWLCARRRDVI